MERQNHIIHRQVAEVGFNNRGGVQPLFQEMSTMFNAKLGDITNSVFDRLVPTDMFIQIDQLELNLGGFSYPMSETEFTRKYEIELEEALALRIQKINNTSAESGDHENDLIFKLSYAAVLQHFLLKGTLPWWASGEIATDPAKTFFALLAEDSDGLKGILRQTANNPRVIKRLVNQFGEQVIKDVVTLIEPSEAAFVFSYHKDVSTLQQKKQLVKAEATSFERSLWNFILTYILVEMGSRFHRKMFVKRSFEQMAAHYNLTYEQILMLYSQTAQKYPGLLRMSDTLPSLIVELKEEAILEEAVETFSDHEIEIRNEEILLHYLFYGSLPFQSHNYSAQHIEMILHDMLQKNSYRVRRLLEKLGSSTLFVKRLVYTASETTINELVCLVEPQEAEFITNYHASVLLQQKKKSIVKTEEPELRKTLWEFILVLLLNDRGSVFNRKSFIESNIHSLAGHYNIRFMDLLLFLTQGIGEELADANKYTSLFYLFAEILREQDKGDRHQTTNEPTETADDEIRHFTFVRNTLLFWLTNGYTPWWVAQHNSSTPEQLLLHLVTTKPTEALLLLQLALQKGIAKTIALHSIAAQILAIVEQTTDGPFAIRCIRNLEELALPSSNLNSREKTYEALLASVLETYHCNQFVAFDKFRFLSILLSQLQQQYVGVSQKVIAKQILTVLKKDQAIFGVSDVKALTEYTPALNLYGSSLLVPLDESDILIEGRPLTSLPANELYLAAVELVEYFLLHNSFPKYVGTETEAQQDSLLRRMFVFIYRYNKAQVQNLLEKTNFSTEAHMRLHNVFAYHNDQETRNIAFVLSTYAERDMLLYIREKWPQIRQVSHLTEAFAWIEKNANHTQRKTMLHAALGIASVASLASVQYKGEAFFSILNYITDEQSRSVIADYSYVLGLAVGNSFDREILLQYLREFSFGWFAAATPRLHAYFFPEFLKFLSQRKNWNILQLHAQLMALPARNVIPKSAHFVELVQQIQNHSAAMANERVYLQTVQQMNTIAERKVLHDAIGLEEVGANPKEPLPKLPKIMEGEKIYVNNAGLVLLNPFINTYLTRTAVVETGKFVSEEAQQRATILLQYLVDNTESAGEQNLVLNKILCGIPVENSICSAAELTESEKKTANDLLIAVTQSWDKLKNTSVQGLQVSFLQRAGVLTENDEAWTLKIEQRAYDILLQTLPWGLSFIKFSWMPKPLFVEWI